MAPAIYLSYDRQAFFAADAPGARVTFDRNICWRNEGLTLTARPGGEQLLQPGKSLMEIKTGSAIPLWLVKSLDAKKIRQVTFSKYGKAYESLMSDKLQRKGRGICA